MARRRFFVDKIQSGQAELHGDAARHLTRVLRVEPGQQYEISDGHSAWLAEIAAAKGDRVLFQTLEPIQTPLPLVAITLCAALFKFDRFEWMVEKATELGVEAILPVSSTRTEKGLLEASHKRSQRWRRIAYEAGQQSRRLAAAEIRSSAALEEALGLSFDHRYFLDEVSAPPILSVLTGARHPGARVALLTGPEGGWTEAERDTARTTGWQPVSLGPQILRAETAALAALAVMTNAWLSAVPPA